MYLLFLNDNFFFKYVCTFFTLACGLNEVFSECGANGCQNTCQNPKLSMVCKGICTPGCVCAEGYLRNSKGACVLIKNCGKNFFSKCSKI